MARACSMLLLTQTSVFSGGIRSHAWQVLSEKRCRCRNSTANSRKTFACCTTTSAALSSASVAPPLLPRPPSGAPAADEGVTEAPRPAPPLPRPKRTAKPSESCASSILVAIAPSSSSSSPCPYAPFAPACASCASSHGPYLASTSRRTIEPLAVRGSGASCDGCNSRTSRAGTCE